eukprot:1157655-Pelagomonas_calceolata.AAC.2
MLLSAPCRQHHFFSNPVCHLMRSCAGSRGFTRTGSGNCGINPTLARMPCTFGVGTAPAVIQYLLEPGAGGASTPQCAFKYTKAMIGQSYA